MARVHLLLASGVLALGLSVATASLMSALAASLTKPHRPPFALVLISAIVQSISCFTWALLILRQYRLDVKFKLRNDNAFRKRDFFLNLIVGIVPSVIAAIITGTALGWSQGILPENHVYLYGRPASYWLNITFAIWGITLAVQAIHVVAAGSLQKPQARLSVQRFSIEEFPPAMTEAPHAVSTGPGQTNPYPSTPESSRPTLVPSEGPSSFRSSFSTLRPPVSRPSSTKKPALVRQYSYPRHSQRSSFESISRRPSQDEGFDSWDTSQVSMQIRETILQSKPSIRKKPMPLAPIPGSRSPSPAKALEGPFFNSSPSESPPASPLPQPSVSRPNSPPSNSQDIPNFTSLFPPATTSPIPDSHPATASSLPRLQTALPPTSNYVSSPISSPVLPIMQNGSRPASVVSPDGVNEAHIHPLFRTTSPSPAPSPSLGTIVTAAPEAGQLVTENTLRRMRSGSLPPSPSPLIRTESAPDIWTRSRSIAYTHSNAPPIPHRSNSRSSQRPVHQRKRSASFEANIDKVSQI